MYRVYQKELAPAPLAGNRSRRRTAIVSAAFLHASVPCRLRSAAVRSSPNSLWRACTSRALASCSNRLPIEMFGADEGAARMGTMTYYVALAFMKSDDGGEIVACDPKRGAELRAGDPHR
jgi:hypothetical protein